MSLDPFALDRSIGEAASALARARAGLALDPEDVPPRPLAGHDRATRRDALIDLEELAARRPDEPTWTAALPWMRALVLSRATFVDDRREAIARRSTKHPIREPIRGEATVHEAMLHVLTSREPLLARAWARFVEETSGEIQALALLRLRRRAEAARLAGIADLDGLDVPVAEPALAAVVAAGVLDATDGMVPPSSSWECAITAALGREGQEGWPAKLGPRWIAAAFPPGALDGTSLAAPTLPSLLGTASLSRALAATGAAFAEADRPRGLPRCLARAPSDLLVVRRAALFGSLVADPEFVRRETGLGKGAAREQAARSARALVISLRADAALTLLRGVTPERGELVARGAETLGRALGAPISAALVGVVPRLDPGCGGEGRPSVAARLLGVVLAASDRERLVETLDEDWFRSPHAADVLRHEHHEHRASARATADLVGAGLDALRRALSATA